MVRKKAYLFVLFFSFHCVYILLAVVFTSCTTTQTSVKSSYISILQPQNGDYIYKTLYVLYAVNNVSSPILEIRLYVDNEIIAIQKAGQFKFDVDISHFKNLSKHVMFIEIICESNVFIRSNAVAFYIDKDSVQYGINQIKFEDNILTINGKPLNNADLSKVELYVDGKLVKIYTNEFDTFFIDLSKYSEGNHDVMLIIYDKNGNMKIMRGLSANTETKEILYSQVEEVSGNNEIISKSELESIIEYPKIEYPKKGNGILADNLYIILYAATDWNVEISDNPLFKNILQEIKSNINNRRIDFTSITETNVYYIRFTKDSMVSQIFTVGFIKNNMVKIGSATFIMGSNTSSNDSEKPEHSVILNDFYISKFEITNYEFYIFLKSTGYKPESRLLGYKKGEESCPISSVTWYDALAFSNWLGVRLPTEAEWEYAAKTKNNFIFSWGNEQGLFANLSGKEDGYMYKAPVGSFIPNFFGLYDMSGNVWEWCLDWYEQAYYKKAVQNNPKGPSKGTSKVVRGGSFLEKFNFLKTITRGGINPHATFDNVGFRIAVNNLK